MTIVSHSPFLTSSNEPWHKNMWPEGSIAQEPKNRDTKGLRDCDPYKDLDHLQMLPNHPSHKYCSRTLEFSSWLWRILVQAVPLSALMTCEIWENEDNLAEICIIYLRQVKQVYYYFSAKEMPMFLGNLICLITNYPRKMTTPAQNVTRLVVQHSCIESFIQ